MHYVLMTLLLTAAVLAPLSSDAQTSTLTKAQQCQATFSTTVSSCAKDLNFLALPVKAAAQKACVASAKLTRDVCLNGPVPPTCQASCQASYDISVTTCETQNDPASCGGFYDCEQIIIAQRSACVSAAVTTLDACTASCPAQ